MNSGFYPQVVSPHLRVQTISNSSQKPFYFGGSSVPISLDLNNNQLTSLNLKNHIYFNFLNAENNLNLSCIEVDYYSKIVLLNLHY